METKITEGKWVIKYPNKKKHCAKISGKNWTDFAKVVVRLDGCEELNSEGVANAKLIVEAGTIANQTGFYPAELLEQRNELLSALKKLSEKTHDLIDHCVEQGFIDWEDESIDGVIQMNQALSESHKAIRKATE